jgi:formylglycine-generating enzyme required for sulfatase activity
VLQLEADGRPRCRDSSAIYVAIQSLLASPDSDAILDEFLGGSRERYEQYIAPRLKHLGPSEFLMGASGPRAPHFMGESPAHRVSLSPFHLAEVPVTNELYALFDPRRQDVPAAERNHPVVGVSWFDAAVFARWMGCRLPTEAEWEFACGGGSAAEWCCPEESMLPRYAWYSETADSQTHAVATREPNAFGFFDMHGNVWEWCQDVYNADFYACSPRHDPLRHPCNEHVQSAHRVTRGGCMHSFAEMCRTRYRFHEAPLLRASDIGFRLARSSNPSTN